VKAERFALAMAEEAARRIFVESSIFDTIVPHASEIDLEDALKSSDVDDEAEEPSLVPSIVQRQTLLFGELHQIACRVAQMSYLF